MTHEELGFDLGWLGQKKIVVYETRKSDQPTIKYSYNPDIPGSELSIDGLHAKTLYTRFREVLIRYSRQTLTLEEWQQALTDSYPEYALLSQEGLRTNISRGLSYWAKQGAILRDYKGNDHSLLYMTPEQRETINDLVGVIRRFQEGETDYWLFGQQTADDIVANTRRFSALMGKAREHSSHASQKSKNDTKDDIESVLRENPATNLREIQEKVQVLQKRRISYATFAHILVEMRKERRIEVTKKGQAFYYSTVSKAEEKQ